MVRTKEYADPAWVFRAWRQTGQEAQIPARNRSVDVISCCFMMHSPFQVFFRSGFSGRVNPGVKDKQGNGRDMDTRKRFEILSAGSSEPTRQRNPAFPKPVPRSREKGKG